MNYQQLILVGNATGDAQRRTSKKGDVKYTSFGVGVSDGRNNATYFPVVVFGEYGESVARYITKGRQVLVDGRVRTTDRGRFSVVANSVRFGPEPSVARKSR